MIARIIMIVVIGAAAAPSIAGPFTFVNVTGASGLAYDGVGPGTGIAVGDIDGDGWDDVLLCGSTAMGIQLFRNNRDSTFTNVTTTALPASPPRANGALFIDLDNDGDQDLAVARWHGGFETVSLALFINEGGYFVLAPTGELARSSGRLGGLAAADVDLDGDVDLVLSHYYGPGFYIRNDGPLGFVDATASLGGGFGGVDRRHWHNVLADFDNDGDPDLHVAIDFGHDLHYHNDGAGVFSDVSAAVGVSNIGADMGLAVGDIDSDGDLDIYSTNIGIHCLYVNDGAGAFTDESFARGVARTEWFDFSFGWGCMFHDFDNDTDLDLAMVTETGTGTIYANDGDGYFTPATSGSGLSLSGVGMATLDFDHDGDMDIITGVNMAPPQLFENRAEQNGSGWLIVEPRGRVSNKSSVGARVFVTLGDLTMMREIIAGQSFWSGPVMYAHFGLGPAPSAERVVVAWPSGRRVILRNVPADQRLIVREPVDVPAHPEGGSRPVEPIQIHP